MCVIFFYAYIFLSDIGNIFEVSTNLLIVISSRKQIREGQAGAGERIGKNKKMLLLTLSPYIVCIFFLPLACITLVVITILMVMIMATINYKERELYRM